jgi:hypothetical protein
MNLNSGIAVNQTGADFRCFRYQSPPPPPPPSPPPLSPPLSLDEAESFDEELSLPLDENKFQPSALELSLAPMLEVCAATHALAPRLSVLHPVHQQVADQRRAADRHHERRHSARHLCSFIRRPNGERWYLRTATGRTLTFSSPLLTRPFIDHSSEMWNFARIEP